MKKSLILTAIIISTTLMVFGQSVCINTDGSSAQGSAILELKSTEKGFLPSRLTTVQRNAISSPAIGLTIYNTSTNELEYYNGSVWIGNNTVSHFIGESYGG